MSVNGIGAVSAYADYNAVTKTKQESTKKAEVEKKETSKKTETDAATYKSSAKKTSAKKTGKPDTATVERMKAEAEQRNQQLRSLVENMMTKQGQTFNKSTDIFQMLREGKLEVDPKVAAQAKADIAEDGYWGVEQTSERLVSFAKALAGNDPSKADELMNAIQKGFKQATKAWGDSLPDICKQTLDATMEKMNKWKDELSASEE